MPKQTEPNFNHKDMRLVFDCGNDDFKQRIFDTSDAGNVGNIAAVRTFLIGAAGTPYGPYSPLTQCYSSLTDEMNFKACNHSENELCLEYAHPENGLTVEIQMQFIDGSNVIRQQTKVTNNGAEPVVLEHLSSLFFAGIGTGGNIPWHEEGRFKVHYCRQTWNGEGQWQTGSLQELGLYKVCDHPNAAAIHFSSVGSWSTGRYYPMIMLEDIETQKIWYSQIETSTNWHFEIGYQGLENSGGSLFIHADGADERFGGWTKKLLPGESFTSVPAAIGCCKGSVDQAVKELTIYRRTLKPKNNFDGKFPIIFNDYMNCLWANPTSEKLIPLIDAATEMGAEGFCLDAGWFGNINQSWADGLGDWNPSPDRFGKDGLQGILDYIKSKGMRPGLWLEIEVCGEESEICKKPDSWFLQRNGKRVGGGARWFFNFENPEVREHFLGVIDRLVSMGVDFIKNDYNMCTGNGDDTAGNSAADGLIEHMRGFYSFVDEAKRRHPDLIIENCGSGAMRSDYGALSHFDMQSSSDQESYKNNPSIITGSLATILPEQLGIWVYPYPLEFDNMNNPAILTDDKYQAEMADGEQTIFNMVNGLCGNMYLSGHLEVADEKNAALIKEGIALYKKERSFIHSSYPFLPLGFTNIYHHNTWAAAGFMNSDNTRCLLAVWRLNSNNDNIEIPLPQGIGNAVAVKQIYPSNSYDVEAVLNSSDKTITVSMPQKYQARYFEIICDAIE